MTVDHRKEFPYKRIMIIGRITAKAQTTIPRAVRLALGIGPGDEIGYEIDGDKVVLTRVKPDEKDMFVNNFSTFTEWSDEYDSVYDRL
jgi:bifunctional DNA-binding transcriptional regulator/antitoxin component of YhaV-PrlF toxin-antitoxin module